MTVRKLLQYIIDEKVDLDDDIEIFHQGEEWSIRNDKVCVEQIEINEDHKEGFTGTILTLYTHI